MSIDLVLMRGFVEGRRPAKLGTIRTWKGGKQVVKTDKGWRTPTSGHRYNAAKNDALDKSEVAWADRTGEAHDGAIAAHRHAGSLAQAAGNTADVAYHQELEKYHEYHKKRDAEKRWI